MRSVDVSIVMAVKNEQLHVESAVLSCLAQQGLSVEVIVVDDHSTDHTKPILSRLSEQHDGIHLYDNPGTGKCAAFNHGVVNARGRFICLFAGDDLMPGGSLCARWLNIRSLPNDVPVVGLCKLVTLAEDKRFNGHLVPREAGRGALSGVSPLMNRIVATKIFPVPEGLPNEDTWMELCILYFAGWTVVHSDIIGCQWRVHAGNSINMLVGFEEYSRKFTARRRALRLFHDAYAPHLTQQARVDLSARIACEESRAAGSMVGVLLSRAGLTEKLRALSTTNRLMYGIRQRLYGILSGW